MNAPDKPQAYTERDLIELACRAPAVPEWFEPDMGPEPRKFAPMESGAMYDIISPTYEWILWNIERKKHKTLQWPKAYARMVLEAK